MFNLFSTKEIIGLLSSESYFPTHFLPWSDTEEGIDFWSNLSRNEHNGFKRIIHNQY